MKHISLERIHREQCTDSTVNLSLADIRHKCRMCRCDRHEDTRELSIMRVDIPRCADPPFRQSSTSRKPSRRAFVMHVLRVYIYRHTFTTQQLRCETQYQPDVVTDSVRGPIIRIPPQFGEQPRTLRRASESRHMQDRRTRPTRASRRVASRRDARRLLRARNVAARCRKGRERKDRRNQDNSHFQDAVALADAGLLGSASR